MNEFHLYRAKSAILEHPEEYCQYEWGRCIAGIAARLAGKPLPAFTRRNRKRFDNALLATQKLLKLRNDQWWRLTQLVAWPKPFRSEYEEWGMCGILGAEIAARRLDRFIETEGRE
jgi:hypothetical protein